MKYYDIEAFQGFEAEFMKGLYSSNDAFFLRGIYSDVGELDDTKPGEISCVFRDILIKFYEYYTGDKLAWLHHTMNIVYAFASDDFASYIWLDGTLNAMEDEKPLTGKQVITKHRKQIEKRTKSLKNVFKELGTAYGFKWTYLNKLWKTM